MKPICIWLQSSQAGTTWRAVISQFAVEANGIDEKIKFVVNREKERL